MNGMPNHLLAKDAFRRIMGCYPTGVCIVTSMQGDEPLGMVVGSFTSISLDPLLVGFFPAKTSRTWAKIAASGRFCVNVLGQHQLEMCKIFASNAADKFANMVHSMSPAGMPIVDDAVAWIDCTISEVHEIGDHYLAVGAVESADSLANLPLVFLRGSYCGVNIQ